MFFKISNYTSMKDALDSLCDFLSKNDVHPDRVFDSRLAACELLGNVLRHEKNEAKLHFELDGGFIHIKVLSDSPFIPKNVALPDLFSEHGRGLFLTRFISENGIEPLEQGKGVLVRIRIENNE